jgi:drug/metabolite transporter (DMT)-like permease
MPSLFLALSLIVLSQSGVFIRYAQADTAAIGFWRLLLALPVLLLFFWHRGGVGELRHLNKKTWAAIALCAFFLFAHWWTWFLSVKQTSLANSMVFFALNPVFTAAGAWIFFGEKLERRQLLAMALCFLGVAAIFQDSLWLEPTHFRGDCLGFLCSMLFSAYVLVGKGIRRRLDNVSFTFATYSLCALYFVSVMLARSVPFTGYSPGTWAAFAALAFGSTLIGHALFTYCLQHFNVNLMSILTLTEPLFTAISGFLLFREPLTLGLAVGFALVAAGIAALYLPLLLASFGKRPAEA